MPASAKKYLGTKGDGQPGARNKLLRGHSKPGYNILSGLGFARQVTSHRSSPSHESDWLHHPEALWLPAVTHRYHRQILYYFCTNQLIGMPNFNAPIFKAVDYQRV